jgi:hypothetical protein
VVLLGFYKSIMITGSVVSKYDIGIYKSIDMIEIILFNFLYRVT